ncbi:MAG: NADH:flavin oxidoreductase/NADH oxidase [Alphaproteobacteria bacterium]|jgi:2,4-dienoyl-CoA reductase-like NADH-dependent reductase (Old Yellow Enzyme family)|nr:NADH:flavin oxidoreductase/NADH oxidase [Alphaproteobacteria bacterium]MDP6813911.1 NADH:flavin oxidoreductase/NADH oxidase [Alphaproteobacteria bacterium]
MTAPMLFSPLTLRDVTLKNRVVVAPMHQYAGEKGFPTDWHLMNAGRFAVGGAGLVIVESTKVERRGCGTVGDLGLWDDAVVPQFRRLSDFIRAHGSVPGIQIGHSGRKARRFRPWEGAKPLVPSPEIDDWEAWELVAPSALADPGDPEPRALSRAEIPDVVEAWGRAAARADAAGFDMLEIHGAHGYLIHQFLSPMANRRNDDYGGTEENRRRFAIEVTECVRANWPQHKPLFLRLSVEDDAGWGPDENVALARIVKDLGIDVIDCSSGGMRGSPVVGTGPVGYGYQVPYAEKIRAEAGLMSMAVGLIVHADQAEEILQRGQADLIALARELLYNPNWPLDAALKLGVEDAYELMPPAYSFWLSKRAKAVEELTPSTYQRGIDAVS